MTIDPDDIGHNPTDNARFEQVLEARLARRSLLRGGVGGAVAALLGGGALSACGGGLPVRETAQAAKPAGAVEALGFTPVGKSLADVVSLPAGYTATVLYALGDPLDAATPDYANDGSDGAFERRAGDHHDGIEFFGLAPNGRTRDAGAVDRGLLAMNHEAITQQFLHPNGATPNSAPQRPAQEIDKEVAAHGVSVVEVRRRGTAWRTDRGSAFNRRITPSTPIEIAGPARGSALLVTQFDPTGLTTRGTVNNCGTGATPWGTLLTGEENWAGYFTRGAADNAARGNDKSVTALDRYGRAQGASSRHAWEKPDVPADRFRRWDASRVGASVDGSDDYRNELNGQGYITEIDPYDVQAPIRKRSALGRFNHESAAFGKVSEGRRLAVYMGDDAQNEYCYKFVSALAWQGVDARAADRIAVGDKYLDHGTLYVARFDADGTGQWIELSLDNPAVRDAANYPFASLADVVVNARLAADAVGATKMDRPEWCGTHPSTGEAYFTMTNSASRTPALTDAANPRSYADPVFGGAPRSGVRNWNGHIVRLAEDGGRGDATRFRWDVYLFGAEAGADPGLVNLSGLTADQDFSSPDGIVFSRATGICWIQTDDGAYTDTTNCMMLAAVPGHVGDGASKTLAHVLPDGSVREVATPVGKAPTTATLKRFLVGPKDCEITGCTETPDGRALFVNIQHPGETISAANVPDPSKYLSHWPGNTGYGAGGANARPRSATIVITKDDGGRIGT